MLGGDGGEHVERGTAECDLDEPALGVDAAGRCHLRGERGVLELVRDPAVGGDGGEPVANRGVGGFAVPVREADETVLLLELAIRREDLALLAGERIEDGEREVRRLREISRQLGRTEHRDRCLAILRRRAERLHRLAGHGHRREQPQLLGLDTPGVVHRERGQLLGPGDLDRGVDLGRRLAGRLGRLGLGGLGGERGGGERGRGERGGDHHSRFHVVVPFV